MGRGKKIFDSVDMVDTSGFTSGKTKTFFDLHFGPLEEALPVVDVGGLKIERNPYMPKDGFMVVSGTGEVVIGKLRQDGQD
ncbi:MAG TPA: hypothetical protein VGH19_06610 [Verrucomicrobiae bacterium]